MAHNTASTQVPQIPLPPNEILINIVQALNGHVGDLTSKIDINTTCNKALDHVKSVLKDDDRPLTLHHVRTWRERQKLKELAKELAQIIESGPNQTAGPLRIRNAIPATQLPTPRRSTAEERNILKEKFAMEAALKQPYKMIHASVEDHKLATIPGQIMLSAIDGGVIDPFVQISNEHCLCDTGAQYCSISADLIKLLNPAFLVLGNHESYRMQSNFGVQVDAVFSLSNKILEISTIFIVLPSSDIPNGRMGIILGQHGFMDRMMVETIPRSILLKRGQEIEDTVWGEIWVKAMLNPFEELQEFS